MLKNEANDFRGLLYNPTYENEVVMLFGLLIPLLEDTFAIDEYRGSFPDCFASRNGQKIGIEFELNASSFFAHENNNNLTKCSLCICWKNDIRNTTTRDGKKFFTVRGHEIEIISLEEKVADLQKGTSFKFIKNGERPDINGVGEERFFEQLKENRPDRYNLIRELYNQVKRSEDFEVKWSSGDRWFTMQIFVKKWGIHPIDIDGEGKVWVSYQGNPKISPWKLPQQTQIALRQIFNRPESWHTIPIDDPTDFSIIEKALEILGEHSKLFNIIWTDST